MLYNYARHVHDTFDSHGKLLTYFKLKNENTTIHIHYNYARRTF